MEKNNKSTIIIIILIIAVVSLVGFIVYDKVIKEEPKDTTKEAQSETQKEEKPTNINNGIVSNAEKEELLKIINDLDIIDYYRRNISSSNPLTNQELLWIALNKEEKYSNSEQVSLDSIQKTINKYFDASVNPEDIYMYINRCTTEKAPIYLYNSDTKTFKYNEDKAYVFACSPFKMEILNKIDSAIKENNTYTVVVYKAYSQNNDFFGPAAYYGKITSSNNNIGYNENNLLFKVEWNPELENPLVTNIESEFNKIDNSKLTKVTYTFEKKDNNYILKSYIVD